MSPKRVTNGESLSNAVKGKNEYLDSGELKLVNYNGCEDVIVEDKYGKLRTSTQNLLRNCRPGIKTALNKTEYFKNFVKSKNTYSDRFEIVGEYKGASEEIEVLDVKGNTHKVLAGSLVRQNWKPFAEMTSTLYFCKKLMLNNDHFRRGDFWVTGEYTKSSDKIEVKNKYGACKVLPQRLLKGSRPSVRSSVNQYNYLVNQARSVHGYEYFYPSWEGRKLLSDFIDICCRKHGEFSQRLGQHLQGSRCPICANNGYWTHDGWREKGAESKSFDSYKIYVIKCWDQETGEQFYKIGKTFTRLDVRFASNKLPYSYEEVVLIRSDDGRLICETENELQGLHEDKKYIPQKQFNGMHECFSELKEDCIESIKNKLYNRKIKSND